MLAFRNKRIISIAACIIVIVIGAYVLAPLFQKTQHSNSFEKIVKQFAAEKDSLEAIQDRLEAKGAQIEEKKDRYEQELAASDLEITSLKQKIHEIKITRTKQAANIDTSSVGQLISSMSDYYRSKGISTVK